VHHRITGAYFSMRTARDWTFPNGQPVDIPVPVQMASTCARGLRPRRVGPTLAMTRRPVLPSAFLHSVGTPDDQLFAAQYSAHVFPLSTLHRHPHGYRCMTRGRRDWLNLRPTELASATTCQFSRRTENVGSQFLSLHRRLLSKIIRRLPRHANSS
jgi:hypothetical protein